MTWEGHPRTTTTPHRKWARAILTRDPVCRCLGCKHHDSPCTAKSTQADHITPHHQQGPPTLDNGQGLCLPCHNQKSSAEGNTTRWQQRAARNPEKHPGIR